MKSSGKRDQALVKAGRRAPESVWDRFRWVIQNRHDYVRQWKEKTGGKAVGYFCTYVPEEVIYASGILPVRILGNHEPNDITEPHIFTLFCPYSRDCLAQGLLGRYDYLEGVVGAHGCYHIRQTYDSWKRHIPLPYAYHVFMPTHVQSKGARMLMPKELGHFRDSLQPLASRDVTSEALEHSVQVHNTNRRLMRQIYQLRQAEAPPLSGLEAMEMVLASMLMDKEEHNQLLQQALTELSQRPPREKPRVRLMLVSSEMDDLQLIGLIESLGGTIVTDDNCIGTRYFWNEAPVNGDPLSAIGQRYLDKPPCPIYDVVERRRLRHIERLAQDYHVQSAILILLKFCDAHQYDMPAVRKVLDAMGIPSLTLECDITNPAGQFRTRLEAHLEMLEV